MLEEELWNESSKIGMNLVEWHIAAGGRFRVKRSLTNPELIPADAPLKLLLCRTAPDRHPKPLILPPS